MASWRERIIRWHERVAIRESRGVGASVARAALGAAAGGFGLAVRLRDALYRLRILPSSRPTVPVISVGNLTLGGAGKTPMVEWLAARCARAGRRVAILSRGYGAIDDEALDDRADLGGVVRLTGANRARLALEAVGDYGAQILILDDGFQHRRLQRDLEVVLVDATRPFGNGRLFPRGTLREPPSALRRAGLIVLTRTDQVTPEALNALRATLRGIAGETPTVETVHRPADIKLPGGSERRDLSWLRGREVLAFCGIGNPEAFRRTLESLGARTVCFRAFPDHHPYTEADRARLKAEAKEFMAEALVTTEKDLRRIRWTDPEPPLCAVRIRLEPVRHGEALDRLLDGLLKTTAAAPATMEGAPR